MTTLALANRLAALLPQGGGRPATAVVALRAAAGHLGLTAADVAQMLAHDPEVAAVLGSRAGDVIERLLTDGPVPPAGALRVVAERFAELTHQPLDTEALRPAVRRIGRGLADGVAAVLAVASVYLVIGGILTGQSHLLENVPPALVLVLFIGTLMTLALFEALHISVTQLKTSDLAALEDSHPRAVRLHREFRTHTGIKRFLAGRQLVVVVTVFFVAGLSGFPGMETLPWTHTPVPGPLRFLIEAGAPGALFTLWFAQLAPQFIATRRAVRLMDTPVVGAAYRLAMALESAGFARPGFWLAAWDHSHETVPSSAAVRWRQDAEELEGHGTLVIVREWRIRSDSSRLEARTSTEFLVGGREAFIERSLMLPAAAVHLHLDGDLHGAGGESRRLCTSVSEERLAGGERVLDQTVMPALGAFAAGDVLVTRLEATFDHAVLHDSVLVERPARELLLRVEFEERPQRLAPVRLRVSRPGDGGEETIVLEPFPGPDGHYTVEATVTFPAPGTRYAVDLEARF